MNDATEQLRQLIRASGRTPHNIALEAAVDPKTMSGFMRGKRGLTLKTAGRVMSVIGVELRPRKADD